MNQVSNQSGWALEPTDSKDAYQMAKYIGESGLCPKDFAGQPQKILVAAAMGQKLGLDVFASMQGIAVINGRPSIWGDVMRSLILAHPHCEDLQETFEGEGDTLTAVCVITRKGMSPYEARFSVQDAKDAGLWGQRTWKGFGKDMLVNRAFGRAARRRFADALNGFHVAEEMQDAEKAKPVSAEVQEAPTLNIAEEPDYPFCEEAKAANEKELPTAQELNDAAADEIAEEEIAEAESYIDDGFGGPVQGGE